MRTNIEIDSELLQQAFELSQLKTEQEVVDAALRQFVQYLRRQQMLELRGQVKWEEEES